MVQSSATRFLVAFSFLLAIATASTGATNYSRYKYFDNLKETNLVFYWHDYATGSNVTAFYIANKPADLVKFGTTVVIDSKLTEAYNWGSPQVGRARGLYTNSALDGSEVHLVVSMVFTSREFNGSTLEIQGSDRFFLKYREVSVVSGTGKFRLARGFAVLENVFADIPNANAVARVNLTIFHHG